MFNQTYVTLNQQIFTVEKEKLLIMVMTEKKTYTTK